MIPDIDWCEQWRIAQEGRPHPADAEFWSNAAPSFAKTEGKTPYVAEFLKLAAIQPAETVLDMGCGAGALALPLAAAGHVVHAADFAQGMLDVMMAQAAGRGLEDYIRPHMLAWDDDWEQSDVPACDVVIASRSLATSDMMGAFEKLASKARRKVCLGLATEDSPKRDSVLERVIGRERPCAPDYVFALNMLWSAGIRAELSFIRIKADGRFVSFDEAIEHDCKLLKASDDERAKLVEYAREHLRPGADDEGNEVWRYDHQRYVTWAFVSWDV